MSSEGENINSMNLFMYMAPIAVILLVPATIFMEDNVIAVTMELAKKDFNIIWYLLFNSCLAYFVNLTNFLVIKHTSALTLQVDLPIQQSFLWYGSSVGDGMDSQAFGAYVFKPDGAQPTISSRLQGSMVIIEGDGESAAAGAIYLATLYASDQQPRRPRRWRLPASTSAVARPNSAAMPRALPAPDARVQSEQEEVCREVAVLREKVMKLEKNGEVRVRALEEEATALQMANAGLEEDNLELALRLRDAEKVALSVNLVREDSRLWIASGTIRVVLGPSVLWICQAQWIWLGFRENDTFRENIRDVIPFPRYPGRADL